MRYTIPALALLSVPALVIPAHADEAEARAVLAAAADAIKQTKGFGAQFRLIGDGSAMIKSTMPAMNGRFMFARHNGEPLIHILGEYRETADAEAVPFDVLRQPGTLTWTDDAKKTIFVRRATPEPRDAPGAARMLHMANLIQDDPFADTLANAESLELSASENVAGVECDVVTVKLAKGKAGHTSEKWYLAKSDRLPRKLEQLTDGGMIKFSLITEFSNLAAGPQAPALLDVRRPEGYTVDDRTQPVTRPNTTRLTPGDVTREEPARPETRQPTPAKPTNPAAPVFAFTDDAGATVDNNTQMGRVTVLYFWGTWCIPCRAVSPEISKIAQAYADKSVDTFGLAIRERDPDAPRAQMRDNDYQHRLVLGAGKAATAFKVRVYPTVVVIAPDGTIAYEGHPSQERTAEKLAEEVRAAIDAALTG